MFSSSLYFLTTKNIELFLGKKIRNTIVYIEFSYVKMDLKYIS
jgi:hypothetical protein